ncbi:dehydration-responsive element-binding protein 1I-like [Panicum virgatum]|uniref:AP2/ERF domain-containing protein n=1 Tax=Panicum virgatum TaxID=38727 RepID=A0A8T0RHH1_PANVG|nr:dehydration-responsive element-binding protein 1I-like [Panicum virgatum]KAG2585542.1 hypothetical protein PVAP13_6KG387300 [Panicum virgatum]
MCMRQIKQEPSSCESVTSSVASTSTPSPAPAAKRPAGRTKFLETRHPVFRGVRRRGRARGRRCRWVCEVRVPGRRGCRLWLGTFAAAEAAARAHDAAMLALRGSCGAVAARRLNFADSAWLLDVPPPAALLGAEGGVLRLAVARAVEGLFLRTRPAAEDATSEPPHLADHDDADATSAKSDDGTASPFEMDDVLSDMGAGLYFASMAQGLLMDPPASCCDDVDCDDAAVPLWAY